MMLPIGGKIEHTRGIRKPWRIGPLPPVKTDQSHDHECEAAASEKPSKPTVVREPSGKSAEKKTQRDWDTVERL